MSLAQNAVDAGYAKYAQALAAQGVSVSIAPAGDAFKSIYNLAVQEGSALSATAALAAQAPAPGACPRVSYGASQKPCSYAAEQEGSALSATAALAPASEACPRVGLSGNYLKPCIHAAMQEGSALLATAWLAAQAPAPDVCPRAGSMWRSCDLT